MHTIEKTACEICGDTHYLTTCDCCGMTYCDMCATMPDEGGFDCPNNDCNLSGK